MRTASGIEGVVRPGDAFNGLVPIAGTDFGSKGLLLVARPPPLLPLLLLALLTGEGSYGTGGVEDVIAHGAIPVAVRGGGFDRL